MLSDNSNKIRNVKKKPLLLQNGGAKGRPRLLHNGINGQKGGKNSKGTAAKPSGSSGILKVDALSAAVAALKKKK